ncbi:MAG: DNA primase [Actinobacteria bacterium]|nr:DNA primase [Actinomycetota bacterium]
MADRGDIDRVREASDIVELVAEVTQVKKSGRSYMAVCPFHQEKTPSMSIDRGRGLYHCFGCGEGGDVFNFVQETQGVGFGDALEVLAARSGITLVRDPAENRQRGRRAAAVDALRRAVETYHQRLRKSSEAGPARAYLRARGYDADLIAQWRIGFAGLDWDTLTKALKAAGISDQGMIDAGLVRRGRHGLHDVFRGRLLFPIHDLRGDPVGFGGRRLEEVSREQTNNPDAKYVNSADSVVYHKAQVLYGLDRARKAIGGEGRAVVVEGYTDVIAMHQAGIETAVATCGTALGDGHFDLLRRFTDQVVLAFDSDEAGERAVLRGDELETPFRLDLDLRVATMPDGLDPADLVQSDRDDELRKSVEDARPLLEHRIQHEVARHDLSGPEGRARALHAAAAQVRRIGDDITRGEYARFVARVVGVDLATAERAIRGRSRPSAERSGFEAKPVDRAQGELLRLALANPPGLELKPDDFTDPRLRAAHQAVMSELQTRPPGTPVDVARVDAEPEVIELLRSLAMDSRPLPDWRDMKRLVTGRRLDAEIDELEERLAELEPGSEPHSDVLRRLIALQQRKRGAGE